MHARVCGRAAYPTPNPLTPRSGKQLRRITPNKATLFNPLLPAKRRSPESKPSGCPQASRTSGVLQQRGEGGNCDLGPLNTILW